MSTKILLTVEEFLQLPEVSAENNRRYELRNGELVEMGETTFWHNAVRDEIFFLLRKFARDAKRGDAFCETGFRIDSNNWYRADVVFWDSEHLRSIDHDQTPIEIVPQLVVEVASPSE